MSLRWCTLLAALRDYGTIDKNKYIPEMKGFRSKILHGGI